MRAAAYARVSTETQTTDNQLDRLREWAAAKGWEIVREYVDIASGANMKRPALDDMLLAAKRGEFDAVIAVKIDRIARSMVNLQRVVEAIDAAGVRLIMLDQEIDTQTASGRLMINLLGSFAEFERELIRERTKDGLARAIKSGHPPGRPRRKLTPYQVDKARRILQEEPGISHTRLAGHFDGISRDTLIKLLKQEGVIRYDLQGRHRRIRILHFRGVLDGERPLRLLPGRGTPYLPHQQKVREDLPCRQGGNRGMAPRR